MLVPRTAVTVFPTGSSAGPPWPLDCIVTESLSRASTHHSMAIDGVLVSATDLGIVVDGNEPIVVQSSV